MSQTRLESLVEVIINVAIGWVTRIVVQLLLFPLFNINLPLSDQFWISTVFTVISIVRSYVIRRWFNYELHRISAPFLRKFR